MRTIHDPRYARMIRFLTQRRKELGVTQADVGKLLGWHRTAVSNIETLERRADVLEVYELCGIYGLDFRTIGRLLEGGRDRPGR